jgi:hypothetical protein
MQDQAPDLVGPRGAAPPIPNARTGVRCRIRITYSDVFEFVLAEASAPRPVMLNFPLNVHAGLSTAGTHC